MIEYSQALLLITTTLVVVSTIAYLGAFFAARMSRAAVAAAVATEPTGTVVINTGDGDRTVAVTGASVMPRSSDSPSPGGPPSPHS